jgi:mannose-6-phosphate isomerase-like protein (cupin superfamily)/putative sterol carrier protein
MIRSKRPLKLALGFLVVIFFFSQMSWGQGQEAKMSDVGEILASMAEVFKSKIDEDYSVIVQFDITDKEESWHVIVEEGRKVSVGKGPHEQAAFFVITTLDTLRLFLEGKMTAMTAAGKATDADHAPLDVKLAEGLEFTPEIRTQFFTFLYHFFNTTVPERILLGEEYSRVVHGGHVVALYYHPGFRSAWYLVKKGEKLNEPKDTNPFPQAFIFIEGEGFAKIGDKTINVKAGESYYIPPNSDHVVWTESDKPLILIYLAWGDGA